MLLEHEKGIRRLGVFLIAQPSQRMAEDCKIPEGSKMTKSGYTNFHNILRRIQLSTLLNIRNAWNPREYLKTASPEGGREFQILSRNRKRPTLGAQTFTTSSGRFNCPLSEGFAVRLFQNKTPSDCGGLQMKSPRGIQDDQQQ